MPKIKPKPPGKSGPPAKPVDFIAVQRCAALGYTVEELATMAGFSEAAFRKRMEVHPELQQVIEDGRNEGRSALRRLQWNRAEAGSDSMLIWLGKQWLGQRDKIDQEHTGRDGEPLIPLLNLTISRD